MLRITVWASVTVLWALAPLCTAQPAPELVKPKADGCVRVATFNVSFNRKNFGLLAKDMAGDDAQIRAVATIIRAVKPDIILLNEVDYHAESDNAKLFAERYLADAKPDMLHGAAWSMPHQFSAAVNTGVPSGLDINGNGKLNEAEDAWGFGNFAGQYGMAVLSRYPIDAAGVRTFQKLKWSSLPQAMEPRDPKSGMPYYTAEVWKELRLSSKSHWDVPIQSPLGTISVLASHPTPPAFDGPADHNGCRNHDEVRLLADYIDGDPDTYLVDDKGVKGGLAHDRNFVIVGDLNSDPVDGDSRHQAIERLLKNPRLATSAQAPASKGAEKASQLQGKANAKHKSAPSTDTADFFDGSVGNLRVDYCLPGGKLKVVQSGVFWLEPEIAGLEAAVIKQLNEASDHHMVWVDVR